MSKDFKEGAYYFYNDDAERTMAIATIHALVQVDGELYAVLSHIDGIKRVRALPVEKNKNGLTVIYLGHGYYLNSDAPVQPKTVKFKVGKRYIDPRFLEGFIVTAKYTDGDSTYIVLDNKFIATVMKNELHGDIVECANFREFGLTASVVED
mgnify:CR=1 FL=1